MRRVAPGHGTQTDESQLHLHLASLRQSPDMQSRRMGRDSGAMEGLGDKCVIKVMNEGKPSMSIDPYPAKHKNKNKSLTLTTSRICSHCGPVGSVPVGLWAQACNSTTDFSGADCTHTHKYMCSHFIFLDYHLNHNLLAIVCNTAGPQDLLGARLKQGDGKLHPSSDTCADP